MKKVERLCPAKVNLFLQILGKRPDGFHELVTLMQTISLFDQIEIELNSHSLELCCDHPEIPLNQKNLMIRAATLFFKKTEITDRVRMRLVKKIPVAAGLGGGSSDAAQTLMGLNELFDFPLKEAQLYDLSAGLGSDVPFFLKGGAAICRGRGEIIEPLAQSWAFDLVLANPGVPLSTKQIYQSLHMKSFLNLKAETLKMLIGALEKKDFSLLSSNLSNDLDLVACETMPQLKTLKQQFLAAGIQNALISGSGPTVFGIVENADAAQEQYGKLRQRLPLNFFLVKAQAVPAYVS